MDSMKPSVNRDRAISLTRQIITANQYVPRSDGMLLQETELCERVLIQGKGLCFSTLNFDSQTLQTKWGRYQQQAPPTLPQTDKLGSAKGSSAPRAPFSPPDSPSAPPSTTPWRRIVSPTAPSSPCSLHLSPHLSKAIQRTPQDYRSPP